MTGAISARARHAAARDLRARAVVAELRVGREQLVSLLGAVDDAEAPAVAAHTLRAHGLACAPPLMRAAAGTPIDVRLHRGLPLQGAVLVGIAATVFGAWRLWIYGALFAFAALLSAGLLVGWPKLVERAVPAAVPRGRWTGAMLGGALTLAIGLIVALPVYAVRRGWL